MKNDENLNVFLKNMNIKSILVIEITYIVITIYHLGIIYHVIYI